MPPNSLQGAKRPHNEGTQVQVTCFKSANPKRPPRRLSKDKGEKKLLNNPSVKISIKVAGLAHLRPKNRAGRAGRSSQQGCGPPPVRICTWQQRNPAGSRKAGRERPPQTKAWVHASSRTSSLNRPPPLCGHPCGRLHPPHDLTAQGGLPGIAGTVHGAHTLEHRRPDDVTPPTSDFRAEGPGALLRRPFWTKSPHSPQPKSSLAPHGFRRAPHAPYYPGGSGSPRTASPEHPARAGPCPATGSSLPRKAARPTTGKLPFTVRGLSRGDAGPRPAAAQGLLRPDATPSPPLGPRAPTGSQGEGTPRSPRQARRPEHPGAHQLGGRLRRTLAHPPSGRSAGAPQTAVPNVHARQLTAVLPAARSPRL